MNIKEAKELLEKGKVGNFTDWSTCNECYLIKAEAFDQALACLELCHTCGGEGRWSDDTGWPIDCPECGKAWPDCQSKPESIAHTTLGFPHYGASMPGDSCSECTLPKPEPPSTSSGQASGEFVKELRILQSNLPALGLGHIAKTEFVGKAAAYIEQLEEEHTELQADDRKDHARIEQLEAEKGK